MVLDVQDFLRLVERSKTLVFWDTESIGREGDYGSILVASVKPFGASPVSYSVSQLGNDRGVVRQLRDRLEKADGWVTYYGKGHDIPLVNTRLVKWGDCPIAPRPHLDLYYSLKYKLATGRHSQAHLLEFFHSKIQKMTLSPSVWSELGMDTASNIATLIKRCESDCRGLEQLYLKTKALVRDIKR